MSSTFLFPLIVFVSQVRNPCLCSLYYGRAAGYLFYRTIRITCVLSRDEAAVVRRANIMAGNNVKRTNERIDTAWVFV